MVFLVFTRDPWLPAMFLVATLLVLLLWSGVPRRRLAAWSVAGIAAMAVMALSFAPFVAADRLVGSPLLWELGPLRVHGAGLEIGSATALRLGALLALVLIGSLTTSGPDLTRALIQQARLPYRIGYGALAAYRFVPRFAVDLGAIRAAHRVRGVPDRGIVGRVRGIGAIAVPLVIGGVRHAERVAMSMDARAFGAHRTRTEREIIPFGAADVGFVFGCWLGTTALILAGAELGLLGRLSLTE